MLPSIESKKLVDTSSPIPFYDNARIMRIVAKALFALTIATVATGITLAAVVNPLAAIVLVGAALFLASGLYFQIKDYWNDPVEVERLSKQAHQMPFNEIIGRFGWYRTFNTLLISRETLNQKFLSHVRKSKMGINEIEKKYKEYNNQYSFYSNKQLENIFTERFNTQTVKDLINKEGGVKGVIKVFEQGLLDAQAVKEKYRLEADKLTLVQVVAGYGWDIFDYFDNPTRFTDEIKHHVITYSLLATLNKYSPELVKKGILDYRTEFFQDHFIAMIKTASFSQIVPHEELFKSEYGILKAPYLQKFHELKAQYLEIQKWVSPETLAAKARYEERNNVREFITHRNVIRDGRTVQEEVRTPNPNYYSIERYNAEIQRDVTRRSGRVEAEVNRPWQQFLMAVGVKETSKRENNGSSIQITINL
jgi:hypothetical protein